MADIALTLLAELLGPVEVIAVGPPDSPMPVTGYCTSRGSSTTAYGPAGSPLCGECQEGGNPRAAKDSGGSSSNRSGPA
jgi:hypothetical protein